MKNAIKHPVNKCALSTYLLYSGTEIEREKPQTQLLTSQHLQHDKDRPFENKCCVVNATDMWDHVEALAGCDGVQVWGAWHFRFVGTAFSVHAGRHLSGITQCLDFRPGLGCWNLNFSGEWSEIGAQSAWAREEREKAREGEEKGERKPAKSQTGV